MFPSNWTFPWTDVTSWITAFILAVLLFFGLGCNGPGLISSVSNDMLKMMDKQVVKDTLQNWSARADVTNPAIGFRMITGGEVYTTGLIVRGDLTGAGRAGVPTTGVIPEPPPPTMKKSSDSPLTRVSTRRIKDFHVIRAAG